MTMLIVPATMTVLVTIAAIVVHLIDRRQRSRR